jgi:hypothetical protein
MHLYSTRWRCFRISDVKVPVCDRDSVFLLSRFVNKLECLWISGRNGSFRCIDLVTNWPSGTVTSSGSTTSVSVVFLGSLIVVS